MRTHYDNLHVNEKASPEVIRAAYKALAQKWHPDRNPDNKARATRNFQIISRAYEVLSDPAARAEYDAKIAKERASSNPGQGDPKSDSQAKPEPNAQPDPERQQKSKSDWSNGDKEPPKDENQKPEQPAESLVAVYPWRRFWARTVDSLIFILVGYFVSIYASAHLLRIDLEAALGDSFLGWLAVGLVSVVFFDAIFIHLFRATPGKWLFNIRVASVDGSNLTIFQSVHRSVLVCVVGQAFQLPFLSAIAAIFSYYRLKRTNSTYWDVEVGSEVACAKIGPFKVIFSVAVTIMVLSINNAIFKQLERTTTKKYVLSSTSSKPFDPTGAVLDTGSAKPPRPYSPAPATAQQQSYNNASIVVNPKYDLGIWSYNDVKGINQNTTWSYINGIYTVTFTNQTSNSIRQMQFGVSNQDCDLKNTKWLYFYVEPYMEIKPGDKVSLRFSATPAFVLPSKTSCFSFSNLWSGVGTKVSEPLNDSEIEYLRAVYKKFPKLDSNNQSADQNLIDKTLGLIRSNSEQGYSRLDSLKLAVNAVAWQQGWVKTGTPAIPEKRTTAVQMPSQVRVVEDEKPCIYKQVMTAADRKACGLN
ncbi:DnaJ domain-containing protein [Pseudomonas aeruginosa]